MRICIFGDSIAWGASDLERGGWVERLKMFYMGERDVDIYNLGISGETTEGLLRRFDSEASIREASVIVFAIGINDSQYIGGKDNPLVSLDQFESNFGELLVRAKKLTNKILVIGLTPVDESKTTPVSWAPTKYYDNESVHRYDNSLKELSEQVQVSFVEMKDVVGIKDMDDGLHPNAVGHQKMFETIQPAIEKLLS